MYKTIIRFEILSEELIPSDASLKDIDYETMEGHSVGRFGDTTEEKLTPPQMAKALIDFGSEPSFFQLDESGNTLEED